MTASVGPNIGLTAGYDPGDNGWGEPYNENLRALDALVFGMTRSGLTAAPPGSPNPGDTYIVAGSGTSGAFVGEEDNVAVWTVLTDLSEAWVFYTPKEGWKIIRVPASPSTAVTVYMFRDNAWEIAPETVALVPAGGTTGQVLEKVSGTDYDVAWASPPYEIAFAYPGAPAAGGVVFAFEIRRNVAWPANFSGAGLTVAPAVTSNWDLDIQKNGVTIGTASITAAGTVASFTTVGGTAKSAVAGDIITGVAPTPADGTAFTLITGTIPGTR